jgi:hypothetical protein
MKNQTENGQIGNRSISPRREIGGEKPGASVAERQLEIVVVFTGVPGTQAALNAAGAMAHGLNTRVRLVAPQAIPYAYSIEQSPIAASFTERLLADLVGKTPNGSTETSIEIIRCRDRLRTMLEVLKPNSLIVIGGRKRLWPTKESVLAKKLRSFGHEVIFAPIQ